MHIVFDSPKRLSNLSKHASCDFADLTEAFFEQAIVVPTYDGRRRAIGLFRGHPITVIYKPLGSEAVSVISMRPASRKERSLL